MAQDSSVAGSAQRQQHQQHDSPSPPTVHRLGGVEELDLTCPCWTLERLLSLQSVSTFWPRLRRLRLASSHDPTSSSRPTTTVADDARQAYPLSVSSSLYHPTRLFRHLGLYSGGLVALDLDGVSLLSLAVLAPPSSASSSSSGSGCCRLHRLRLANIPDLDPRSLACLLNLRSSLRELSLERIVGVKIEQLAFLLPSAYATMRQGVSASRGADASSVHAASVFSSPSAASSSSSSLPPPDVQGLRLSLFRFALSPHVWQGYVKEVLQYQSSQGPQALFLEDIAAPTAAATTTITAAAAAAANPKLPSSSSRIVAVHPIMLPPFTPGGDAEAVRGRWRTGPLPPTAPSAAAINAWTAHKLAKWRVAMEATALAAAAAASTTSSIGFAHGALDADEPAPCMEVWLRQLAPSSSSDVASGNDEYVSAEWMRIERSPPL
jgi:hypothetical protein